MAAPFATPRAPVRATRWWAAKTRGDRRVAAAFAMVIGALIAWWALWQPLVRDIAAMRATAPRAAVALGEARRMADDMAGLTRMTAPKSAADPRADLERVLAQQGMRNAVTQLDWQEGRARLVFAAVGYGALIAALEALQRDAHLTVVEATLTARVESGSVRAEIVVAR